MCEPVCFKHSSIIEKMCIYIYIYKYMASVNLLAMMFAPFSYIEVRIGIYGDEANTSENLHSPMKVLCVHMNVILYRPKSVRLSRYPLFTLRSELIAGPLTLRPLLKRIAWSLNLAFDGVGSLGEQLCPDGERFVVAEFRGDQEFHRKLWQHSSHWNSHCPCFRCHSSSVDPSNLYTDFSDNPRWLQTECNNVQFINEELPDIPCH